MARHVLTSLTVLTLAAFAAMPSTAIAGSRVVSDDALARASAAAVHGRVAAIESSWDAAADTIYTYVTIDVVRSWGLPGSPARVVVKQLGGVVNDIAFVVGGQARFEIGEECLVFLDVRPRDRTLSVAGLENGKWTVTATAAAASAMAREIRGTDPGTVVARDYRTVAQLHALAALTGSRASAAGATLAPSAGTAPDAAPERGVAAFTLLSPATPARWHEADSGANVYLDTQSGGHPQMAGGGLTQLARAAGMWDAAGSLSLQPGVQRSPRCFNNSEPSDGRISVTYGDPCGEIADESWTLAIGGAYYSSSDVRSVNGVSYWKIVKGMIVTDNSEWKYSGMSTGCYEELIAHEIGHAIGFGHAADRPALMYPAITSDCSGRTGSIPLSADEIAGMAAIYQRDAVPDPPPAAPTGLTASISGSTVSISWTAPSGGTPPQGYVLYAGTAPGLSNVGMASTNATGLVVPNVPDGIYYIRVVSVSTAGTSAPTPDYTVNVRVAPPAAPVNAMGSVGAGGNVYLSWMPAPSGGTPARYRVLVGYAPGQTVYQFPVTQPALGAARVPAATYYVRIVAENGAGVSPPSTELTIVVP
jgi:hypothetical protein